MAILAGTAAVVIAFLLVPVLSRIGQQAPLEPAEPVEPVDAPVSTTPLTKTPR